MYDGRDIYKTLAPFSHYIDVLKIALEKTRALFLSEKLATGSSNFESDGSAAEKEVLEKLEMAKVSYKNTFVQLKDLKLEIEHLQHLLDNARLRLQKDFEQWYTQQTILHGRMKGGDNSTASDQDLTLLLHIINPPFCRVEDY